MRVLPKLEDPEQTLLIIGMIIRGHDPCNYILTTVSSIKHFLGLDAGDIASLLYDMMSLLSWDDAGSIRYIFHGSFGDFLFDVSRSEYLPVDPLTLPATMAFHCIRLFQLRVHDPASEGLPQLSS